MKKNILNQNRGDNTETASLGEQIDFLLNP